MHTRHTLLFLAALLLAALPSAAQQFCPTRTCKDTSFWVAFLYNYHETDASANPGQHRVTVAGDQSATITLDGPEGESVYSMSAGGKKDITVGNNSSMSVATVSSSGYHLVSTVPVHAYACNYVQGTQDVTLLFPESELDTVYTVQNYPAWEYGAQVCFVATENNTTLTMTVPCAIQGTSITSGTTLTPTLQKGQTYLLISKGNGSSFSGMTVTSNGKPFAMFQGGRRVKVPTSGSGSDMLFEQAVPRHLWGKSFIVPGASPQTGSNYMRITASEDGTVLTVNGTVVAGTLDAGETYETSVSASGASQVEANNPVSVILYLTSYLTGGSTGDPSSVAIPPLSRGVCSAHFATTASSEISVFRLNIVCPTIHASSMKLDGSYITGGSSLTVGDYTVRRVAINYGSSTYHKLENDDGPFVAYAYGLGNYESYAYAVDYAVETVLYAVYDTVHFSDSVCRGYGYDGYGFHLTGAQTDSDTNFKVYRDSVVGDTVVAVELSLAVQQPPHGDEYVVIAEGDTLVWGGTAITQAGDYDFTIPTGALCDSTLTLHVAVTPVRRVDLFDTLCRGQAYGTPPFHIASVQTDTVGTLHFQCDTLVADTIVRYLLALTIQEAPHADLWYELMLGDTLFFEGDTLHVAGNYVYTFAVDGPCDSVLTVHVAYAAVTLTASPDSVCPDAASVLTATGLSSFYWAAVPDDPSLEAQQGQSTVTVHPHVTTTYTLLDAGGNAVQSVTVHVLPPPVLCLDVAPPYVDFDSPVVVFDDCSEGNNATLWTFDDGHSSTLAHVRYRMHDQLADSLRVTLHTCNAIGCCVDTALALPVLINSVWFPNTFTPDRQDNNTFGCATSMDITDFELTIYNRFGQQVWHSDDVDVRWDGTSRGKPLPQGSYVFRWHLRDSHNNVRSGAGNVLLLR